MAKIKATGQTELFFILLNLIKKLKLTEWSVFPSRVPEKLGDLSTELICKLLTVHVTLTSSLYFSYEYIFYQNLKIFSYLGHSLHHLGIIASGYSVGLLSSYNISSVFCFVRLTTGSQKFMFLFIFRIKPPIHSLRRSQQNPLY